MNRWRALVLIAASSVFGCAVETPSHVVDSSPMASMRTMTLPEARAILEGASQRFSYINGESPGRYRVTFDEHGVEWDGGGGPRRCRFASLEPRFEPGVFDNVVHLGGPCGLSFWKGKTREDERRVLAALQLLSDYAKGRARFDYYDAAEEAAFRQAAARYRSERRQLTLPEEARRYRIQAEGAFKARQYERAVELYREALRVAPWWPDGYFNRALLLGDHLGFHLDAIAQMKRYLELEPAGTDARAAQDKIYEWEGRVGR